MFFDTDEQDVIRRSWASAGNFWDVASEAGDIVERRQRSAEVEFRTLIGANEGESTVDALHRYTSAVQLGCALRLEQRAKEIAENPPLLPVDKIREVTVAALVGGAALLRQCVPAAAGQVLSAHVDKAGAGRECRWSAGCGNAAPAPCGYCDFHCGHARGVCAGFKRYPCSPTCTHDDAATPGHPERVKERSEAVVSVTAEEFQAMAADPEKAAYDAGAEAMRAACWEAVRQVLQRHGFTGEQVVNEMKAAIEGAAP